MTRLFDLYRSDKIVCFTELFPTYLFVHKKNLNFLVKVQDSSSLTLIFTNFFQIFSSIRTLNSSRNKTGKDIKNLTEWKLCREC